jgi:hypothetical protein
MLVLDDAASHDSLWEQPVEIEVTVLHASLRSRQSPRDVRDVLGDTHADRYTRFVTRSEISATPEGKGAAREPQRGSVSI